MIGGRRGPRKRPPDGDAGYRRAFLGRVHQLLDLAHRRSDAATFGHHEETAITGELVRVMDEIIDDPASPRWARHFSVHDDPPVNAPGRLGRSRRRLDIRFVSTQRIPRSRFSFEAKRLGRDHPVANYLGPEGLGCFLTGDYARGEPDVGMLGYVQTDTPQSWSKRIGAELTGAADKLGVIAGHDWAHASFTGGPKHTYRTRHARPAVGHDVNVYHTILACC